MFSLGRVVRIYTLIGVMSSMVALWVIWNMMFYTSESGQVNSRSIKLPHLPTDKEIINVAPVHAPPFIHQVDSRGVIQSPAHHYITEEAFTVAAKRQQIVPPKIKNENKNLKVTRANTGFLPPQVKKPSNNNKSKNKPSNQQSKVNKNVLRKPKLKTNPSKKQTLAKPKANSKKTKSEKKKINPKFKLPSKQKEPALNDTLSLDMKAIEQIMTSRRERVQRVCGEHGYGPKASLKKKDTLEIKMPPTPQYDIFYINVNHKLAWCPIYKAASTSWLYNYCKLAGASDDVIKRSKDQLSVMTRRYYPELQYDEVKLAMNHCMKFMIVRHPFERLVSAYRDKLENINIGREHGTVHFYEKYGKKIREKYRGNGKNMHKYSQDMDNPDLPKPKGVEPTFEEFVKYLIDTDLVYYSDDHWMPYYLHCTPCHVNYDVIAKFETLFTDQEYIIQKKKLGDIIQPSWKHLTKGKETSSIVQKYFSTISKNDLYKLYHKYKMDFELFDYNIDDYLKYVRK